MKLRRSIYAITLTLVLATMGLAVGNKMSAKRSAHNPTGTWEVTINTASQSSYKPIMKLRFQRGKLNGTFCRRHNQKDIEMAIEDAIFKANDISFTVSIPPVSGNAPNYLRKFQGKFSGNLIKGQVEDEWMGQIRTHNWEAKRLHLERGMTIGAAAVGGAKR